MDVVCIGGMHRSGTSMVANLVCECGLYLGDESDLIPATPDNVLGYWENKGFVEINTEILEILGGKWYAPPIAPAGWATKKELAHVKRKAELLVQEFSRQEHWGWKDPRSSLTLPFWTSLVPDLKVIICLRNPLEVALSVRRRPVFSAGNIRWRRLKEVRAALSLTRRRFFSLTACLKLWQTYNERILEATTRENRIITHYEAYLRDAQSELRRVLQFLGMPASQEVIDRSSAVARLSLRHNRFSTEDLKAATVPAEVLDLYLRMCEEAGFHHSPTAPNIAAVISG